METEIERKCCKSSPEIIDRKFEDCECISDTDGFHDVCMNKNILEALGAWHHFSGEQSVLCNKSFRFIAYKQYIWWIYGKLGKDIRKPIPSCIVNKVRNIFPAPDNIYIPYNN